MPKRRFRHDNSLSIIWPARKIQHTDKTIAEHTEKSVCTKMCARVYKYCGYLFYLLGLRARSKVTS